MDATLLQAAMSAIGSAYGKKAADITTDQVKQWFEKATSSVEASGVVDGAEIEALANSVLRDGTPILDAEVTRKNLARWFEVPQEEFSMTPPEQLEPEVLIRHIYLENQFTSWFNEWGYDVEVGEDLEGLEGIDFTPDVYGKLTTLHGEFEICINFVCDQPPSQYRVRALLETLEAVATDESNFKWGDVYILATPFQFGRGAASSIILQSKEEKYTVIPLEYDDIYNLQNSRDSKTRLVQLMEQVKKAQELGPQR